ncbi:conserved hypothetical protein [uncultured Stenotrophomonas sp.]|uniref:Uncharacterized protein n=1 Tax=uncultured Stenotrophomonas sp. TaxID=165438 RepID=A0A1Y5Q5I4_9GAMM|nr:conserved hypothetical protein [uncultured Stenotrophomonas sp.]
MKTQFRQQSLRLRVDEDELARLLAGETVTNALQLGDGAGWSLALRLHADDARLSATAGDCHVTLPLDAVRELQARLPSREGLCFDLPAGSGGVQLQLDVDVRDSMRRRGPSRQVKPAA